MDAHFWKHVFLYIKHELRVLESEGTHCGQVIKTSLIKWFLICYPKTHIDRKSKLTHFIENADVCNSHRTRHSSVRTLTATRWTCTTADKQRPEAHNSIQKGKNNQRNHVMKYNIQTCERRGRLIWIYVRTMSYYQSVTLTYKYTLIYIGCCQLLPELP